MLYSWSCRCCGKQFQTLPLDFACRAPDPWFGVPETERGTRSKLDSDVCIINQNSIFVRGCLEIPVLGSDERFIWGLWASVSKQSFQRILDLWQATIIEDEPPIFGWLSNNVPTYPATFALKTHLHLRANGARPSIELEPTDHPLAVEQRVGISLSRVEEIAAALSLRH
jgi:hypothetical protein